VEVLSDVFVDGAASLYANVAKESGLRGPCMSAEGVD